MSTRNIKIIMFLEGRALPVLRADNQCGILSTSQSYRPPRPVTGIALLYLMVAQPVYLNIIYVAGFEVLTAVVIVIAAIFWYIGKPPAVRWFLAWLIFDPEDGGDTFLLSVCSRTEYMVLYSYTRIWQHS
jgi:hypothetical protein